MKKRDLKKELELANAEIDRKLRVIDDQASRLEAQRLLIHEHVTALSRVSTKLERLRDVLAEP